MYQFDSSRIDEILQGFKLICLDSVPIVDTLFMENHDYEVTDPYDGAWNAPLSPLHTIWDDLYNGDFLGAWVEIPEPAKYGLSGGIPLQKFHLGNPLSERSEGYVISLLHQLHCVGELKHILLDWERYGNITTLKHGTHCVEYLRQAVMCSADLSLEKPRYLSNASFQGSNGWDAVHKCRDWSTRKNASLPPSTIAVLGSSRLIDVS
ncbi:uncharacterized protein BO95DRAFT_436305 [Aspergillus brunneoviolaceus CBS 621.78]|uniref:Uncharacterized protein n=1 Tax=Aspergillus brunneoviolaceus CBS 621.78 TaxID=1450534 RepID=A0ACD1FV12_9EURO|nr:hypothetical protein BO95DRAFT_436305 [Aspergillus brunneoviolaceus CBS 621.78]RAH40808.1 hypothetical protein BO95DRAFT_436305 [Aspergillus brunneoviolaceus CBS 621.78]